MTVAADRPSRLDRDPTPTGTGGPLAARCGAVQGAVATPRIQLACNAP